MERDAPVPDEGGGIPLQPGQGRQFIATASGMKLGPETAAHHERHNSHRIGGSQAVVRGANDGTISVASLEGHLVGLLA